MRHPHFPTITGHAAWRVALAVLVLTLAFFSGAVRPEAKRLAADGQFKPSAAGSTATSLAGALQPNGTLKAGLQGSFDTDGYRMETMASGGPRFVPASTTANCNDWDTQFMPPNGVNNTVYALLVSGTDIYVGGLFTVAGNVAANNVAKFDTLTNTWSTLGTGGGNGVDGSVHALAVSGSDLYVGGGFTTANVGGTTVNARHVAKYNTATGWSALGTGGGNGVDKEIYVLAASGSDLFVGGDFTTANVGATTVTVNSVAKYSAASGWSALGTGGGNGVSSAVYTLTVSGNDLYVGGAFMTTNVGGTTVSANHVAKYNAASGWSALGTGGGNGVDSIGVVNALAVNGNDLYVGGYFLTVNVGGTTVSANHVAKYNAANGWSALGTGSGNGVDSVVFALAVNGSGDVYVGGTLGIANVGGMTLSINNVAKYNAASGWNTLGMGSGNGVNGTAYALAASGNSLYVGGNFSLAGGKASSKIGRFYDYIPPTIICPANIFVGTTGNSTSVTYPAPTVNDTCSGANAPICTPASGSSFNVGVTTVTCTVTGAQNYSTSCSFTVTVNRVSGSAVDPLACTGPGNTVQATLVISNNGNVNQTVSDTTTFTNLVGVPNTCTVSPNVGTCTVTNGGLTYTNTSLAAGQTVTLTYLTQVSDLAPAGAQVCTNNSVAFNGGTPFAFSVCGTVNCPAGGPGSIFPATSETGDQSAGSVLIYNVFTSGATSGNTQNTRINITNTHPRLSAFVHLFFVAEGCSVADSYLCLTANQTASFLASDLDPGTSGYLVAVAVDGVRGCPTNFNYLIGDEYVKFSTGHAANLGAEAFSALAGGLPACDGNSVTALLNFDGVSYNRMPAVLALDSIGSRADGNDTLLIVNRIGGNLGLGASTLGTLFGIMYDDSENALSFSVAGNCQLRNSISNNFPRTTPRFESFIPAGRTGWLKLFNQTGAIGITGAAINNNPNANSSAGAFNQGHNLHALTLTNSNYVIPVFPPSC